MKKGSLQLSVGAIITLIIAVALLGLVISFVATQFNFFSGRIALNEVTPEPTSSNSITLPGGRNSLELTKNTDYEMTVKVYNSNVSVTATGTGSTTTTTTGGMTNVSLAGVTNAAFCASIGSACGSAQTNVQCSDVRELTGGLPETQYLRHDVINFIEAGVDTTCSNIACGPKNATNLNKCTAGTQTLSSTPGAFTLTCGDTNVNNALKLQMPQTTVDVGVTEIPILVGVASNAPVGKTPCTLELPGTGAKKSLFVTIE